MAIVTMTIDHLGAILFPDQVFLRVIGRISFPLFCYLVVLGADSTNDKRSYLLRLVVFSFISQIPYSIAFGLEPFERLNIFFTLSFGFLVLINPILILISFPLSLFLNIDFGAFGIMMMACMRVLENDTKYGLFSLILLGGLSLLIFDMIQFFFLLVIPIVLLCKRYALRIGDADREFPYPSWMGILFYFYYPTHLVILHLFNLFS